VQSSAIRTLRAPLALTTIASFLVLAFGPLDWTYICGGALLLFLSILVALRITPRQEAPPQQKRIEPTLRVPKHFHIDRHHH